MNRPTIEVYIAVSVDGYIADDGGTTEWLELFGSPEEYGYESFYAGVGALVMGRATYEQVAAFPEWPYVGKPVFVLSSRPPEMPMPEAVRFVHVDIPDIVRQLRETGARRVWHVGGGKTIAAFLNAGCVDAWRIFVIPTLLGDGIRLFPEPFTPRALHLVESRAYANGVVELRYEALDG